MGDELLEQWVQATSKGCDESLIGVSPTALRDLLRDREQLRQRIDNIWRLVEKPPETPRISRKPVSTDAARYRASILTQIRIAVGDRHGRLSPEELVERIRRLAVGDELWEFLEDPRFELYFRNGDWNACFTDDDVARHLKGANPRALMEELVDDLDDEGFL